MNMRTGHARNRTLHPEFVQSGSNHWDEDPYQYKVPLFRIYYISSCATIFIAAICDFARCGRGLRLTICGCVQSEVFVTLNIRVWSFVCLGRTTEGTLPLFLPSSL
jgi:hypothetical protein